MECGEVKSRLVSYVDENLSGPERAAIQRHMDGCYLCQEQLNELTDMLERCREALQHPRPRNRYEALRPLLHPAEDAMPAHVPARRGFRLYEALALAALIMILVGASRAFLELRRQYATIDTHVAAATEDVAPAFTPRFMAKWRQQVAWAESLSDGSEVKGDPRTNSLQSAAQTEEPMKAVQEGDGVGRPTSSQRSQAPGEGNSHRVVMA